MAFVLDLRVQVAYITRMHGRERLAAWIERSKLTQRAAAKLLGFHYTALNQILSGRHVPALANAMKIERVTGIAAEAWLPTVEGESVGLVTVTARKRK